MINIILSALTEALFTLGILAIPFAFNRSNNK